MTTGVVAALRQVKGPVPLLDRATAEALTPRQQQVLDSLHVVFAGGFAHLTMADMAAAASCSLRTLYELAPSKDELVRIVVDRHLWSIGRTATGVVDDDMVPLDAIRAHLHAAHEAISGMTEAFAADALNEPGTAAINLAHGDYLVDVTRALLDHAVERGDIAPLDTSALARVLANVGADFSRPDVLPTLTSPPKKAADAVVDVILAGLR